MSLNSVHFPHNFQLSLNNRLQVCDVGQEINFAMTLLIRKKSKFVKKFCQSHSKYNVVYILYMKQKKFSFLSRSEYLCVYINLYTVYYYFLCVFLSLIGIQPAPESYNVRRLSENFSVVRKIVCVMSMCADIILVKMSILCMCRCVFASIYR